MYIKAFREQQVRVQDPLRPGRRVFETRLIPSGASTLSHPDGKGGMDHYEADEDGWLDAPHELAAFVRNFRGPSGERWYTPDEVGEEVASGRIQADPADELPASGAKTTKKAAAASADA